MPFDVQGARRAGYSDAEIADYLAREANFNAAGARKSGYTDREIIDHIEGNRARDAKPPKGVLERAGDAIGGAARAVGDAYDRAGKAVRSGIKSATGYDIEAANARSQAEHNAWAERDIAAKQQDVATQDGIIDRVGDFFTRGELGLDAGVRRVMGATGDENATRLARAGEKAASTAINGEIGWEEVKDNWLNAPQFILEKGVESLPSMAAAATGPGAIMAGMSNTGQIGQSRAEADGRTDATGMDVGIAAPFGIASALLDVKGLDSIVHATGSTAVKRIAKAALAEGGTEAIQSGLEYTGGAAGTKQGWSAGEMADQALQGGLVGMGVGGVMRAGEEGGAKTFRLAGAALTRRPIAPGVRAQAATIVAAPTDEDLASPIPTDIIMQGKAAVADAEATASADSILRAAGMPKTGTRVKVIMPDGSAQTGTVADAFMTDAGEMGTAAGMAIQLDNGTTFAEHFETLSEAGVKIAPHDDALAEADAIDAGLAAQAAQAPVEQAPAGLPAPVTAGIHPAEEKRRSGAPVGDGVAIAKQLFPKARITSGYRAPDHALSKANPNSWHTKSHAAVDMAPIPGMTFEQAKQTFTDAGYTLIEALNETGAGKTKHATGDHWHFVIGAGQQGGNAPRAVSAPVDGESVQDDMFGGPSLTESQIAARENVGLVLDEAQAEDDTFDLRKVARELDAARVDYEAAGGKVSDYLDPHGPIPLSLRQAIDANPNLLPLVLQRAEIEDAAANVAAPTDAQKEAGNYRKGHVRLHGLDITIETPRGAERSGVDPSGKPWSVAMPDHYGYVKRTEGADGEQVDVYVGENPESDRVYLIDQNDADTGKFDEHKAMLGFRSRAAALDAYHAAFDDGRGGERMGNVVEMSAAEFKQWLAQPQTTPAAETATTGTGAEAPAVQPLSKAEDLPPVAEGSVRLWRGNRPGEVGKNPQFTNDLNGIARPFQKGYGGPLSYVDVPSDVAEKALNRDGAAATGAEFSLPAEWAARAKIAEPGESNTPRPQAPRTEDAPQGWGSTDDAPTRKARVEDTGTGKSVAIVGASEAELAAIAKAIPNAKPLKRNDGATVYSKKYEAKIRAVLADHANTAGPQDGGSGLPVEAPKGARPDARPADGAGSAAGAITIDDGTFQRVWKDPKFRKTMKDSGNSLPHTESSEARKLAQGWYDGGAFAIEKLREHVAELEANAKAQDMKPTGFNPSQSYINGFYARVTGKAKDIRQVKSGDKLGATEALREIEQFEDSPPPAGEQAPSDQEPALQESATSAPESPAPSKPDQESDTTKFAGNKVFTEDKVAAARARLKEKFNRLNAGIDPELLMDGIVLAGAHIEAGVRKFADLARTLAADLGSDLATLKPYLRAWYNGARDMLEDAGEDVSDMDGPGAVKAALTMIEDQATTPAEPAIAPPETSDANAQPASLEGNDRGRAESGRPTGLSESEGQRDAGSDRGEPGRGSDADVSPDARGRGTADRVDGDARRSASGAGKRETGGDRNSAKPGDRVQRTKPAGAGRGLNFYAPAGSLAREGGWKKTAERNLDIVELVNRLDADRRPATPEEQALLAKWTGWGAGEIRNNLFRTIKRNEAGGRSIVPPTYGEWKAVGERAARLLQGAALETALQSTQYAHYTSEAVIRSIWRGMERLGFTGGKILEPGMGSGLFAIAAPKAIMEQSHYTGIEMDAFTARVAHYLLPQENVLAADYVKQKLPDGFFDVAIGNPPFANIAVTDDPAYRRYRFSLHDYFFAKSIDKVRPGGLMVFVTSRYTMDKLDRKAREYIADRADLLGAVRLPQTAFKENAGTEVVTDVLFFQRRAPGVPMAGKDWLSAVPIKIGSDEIAVNSYYVQHPEMVLGEHATTGSMYRKNEYTVAPKGDIEQAFAKAVEALPEGVFLPAVAQDDAKIERKAIEADMTPSAEKEGGVYLKDGTLFVRTDGVGVALEQTDKLNSKEKAWLTDYVPLRDAVKQAQRDQLTDGPWEKSLATLNKLYDAFVKKHGQISAFTQSERTYQTSAEEGEEGAYFDKKEGEWVKDVTRIDKRFTNRRRLRFDVESTLVEALEKISDDGKITKGPFLMGRTIDKPQRGKVESATDAVAVTLDEIGRFEPDYAAQLLGVSVPDLIAKLGDQVYEQPGNGGYALADEYLSGDVVEKLEQAQAAAASDPRFERNVTALLKVQPKPLAYADIAVRLGAGWIEPHVVEQFADEVLGENLQGIHYEPATGSWIVPDSSKRYGRSASSEYATEDRSARELLDAVLNNRSIKITRKDSESKKTYTDAEATALANERAKKIGDKFKTWIWTDAQRAQRLSEKYNRMFNNLAPRKFDGGHLTFPGLSTRYKLYDHQRRAIWRVIATGNTYLNHAVGAGKTLEMIVSAMEQRRLGLVRKPMFVVPNHMLNQFAREFLDAYPAANIMVADEHAFHTDNRRRFMAKAALNNPDAIIVSHSSLVKIDTLDDTRSKVVDRFIGELEAAMEALDGDTAKHARKDIENQIERIKRQFAGKADSETKDRALTFDEMGVDYLYVDEAHEFRKLDFATNRKAVKGIDSNGSKRALDLYIKLLWLNEQRPGRAATLASGTPITNTMAEIFTVMRYMDQAGLERDGLAAFDAWAANFGEVVPGFEQNAAGGYEIVERFSKFVNVPELMKRVRTFMDVLTSAQLGDLVKRPDVRGGGPENVVVQASDDLTDYMKVELWDRIQTSRKWKPSKDQPYNPDPLINIITDGRLSAIDMRFVDNTAPNDPESKLNKMIDKIIENARAFREITYTDPASGKPMPRKGATQIVFSPVGFGDQVAKNRGFDARAWVNKRLSDAGISPDEIAWMGDQNSHAKKEATFKAMRAAEKTVLLGSPKNMGTGVNVQARLKALHFLSPPWYPSDVEQPHGRIIRQGNMNPEVDIYWYATKGTYDSTGWQMVSRKAKFIEQAMSGDESIRSIEDISEANQYEMASALAAGDERAIQLAGLSNEIERLTKLRAAHADEQMSLRYEQKRLERAVERETKRIGHYAAAIEARGPTGPLSLRVDGISYDRPGEAGAAMIEAIGKALDAYDPGDGIKTVEVARYRDALPVNLTIEMRPLDGGMKRFFDLAVQAGPVELTLLEDRRAAEALDAVGLAQRVQNATTRLEDNKREIENQIERAKIDQFKVARKLGAPFEYEADLAEKVSERARLEADLASETAAAQKLADEAAKQRPKASIPEGADPVAALTGDELGDSADLLDLGKKARAWYKLNLRLKSITASDGAKVMFSWVGENKLSGGDRILRAVPAIKAIIEKGEHAGPFPPSEKWAARGVTRVQSYTARVAVAGETRSYGVMVHELADGRRFYNLTDDPRAEGIAGGRSSLIEGRPGDVARVEVTAGSVNLFEIGDSDNGPGIAPSPVEDIPADLAERYHARDAEQAEMGAAARADRAAYDQAVTTLGDRLKSLGLSDRVALALVDKIRRPAGENAAGEYWQGLVRIALDSSQAPIDTLNHEAIHALRDLGLIYDGEWAVLERAARADTAMMASVKRRYPLLDEAGQIEEAIADRFKNWAANPAAERSLIARAFDRARRFLEALGNALRGNGFTTAEAVMRAIDAGEAGARAGARASAPAGARYSVPDATFTDSETEDRFQAARAGLASTQTWRERAAEYAETAWHGITRHWIALPNQPRYAALQEKLRAIEAAPQSARERTIRMLDDMVKDFTDADLDLFTRKVILDDLAWDAANERDLPFGFTPETLLVEKAKIDKLVAGQPDQRVFKAAMKRKLANRRIAEELVKAGVLEAEQIKNPAYYRHQVLEYARAQAQYARTPGKKLRTPKWAKRMGSSLDINANLLEAEFDWLNKAFIDIPVAQTIEWIKKSEHNILTDLKKQAKAGNDDGVAAHIAAAKEVLEDDRSSEDERVKAMVLIDQEKGFRQYIAMGFEHVRTALENDEIDVPARFRSAADAIEGGRGAVGDPPFDFLAWMLDTDAPGAMGAAMVMKAISQRRVWTKNLLGRAYIDPMNAEELVKRLAPEGYRTWQPDEGKLLFTVKTLPEHVIDGMIDKLDSAEGIDPTAFRGALEGARSALAMGGSRYTMILPEEVADTLSHLRREEIDNLFDHLLKDPVKLWKRWVLINPRRFIKYNLNNLTGDLDAVIAGHPALLRRIGAAGRELFEVMTGKAKASPRYEEAVARGVFDSGLSIQEIPDIHQLAPFERFANKPGPINKVTVLPLRKAWAALQGATQWRENVMRYAAYLDYVERIEAGESQASIGYGASRKDMVDAVEDPKDRAAMLARDLMGDYGAISHYGGWLRQTIIPFWSWMEINTKRYWRLTMNAGAQGIGKGIATGGGLALAKGARTTAWLGLRMALIYGLLSLWNGLFFPDEEEELGEAQRNQMHLILGRNAEGEIITIRTQGAMSDALSWFGLGDVADAARNYELGRGSLVDVLGAGIKAPINKIGTSLSPVITVPVETATGKKLWPDVFNPRANRDSWRNVMSSFSLENEYDLAMGKPSRGYGRSWQEAVIYRRDPGEMAYNEARSITYEWLEREKGQTFEGGFSTKRGNAMRDYRTAKRYGDEAAADKALHELAELGADRGDMKAMLKRAAPLGPIPKKDRAAFVAQLTDEERATMLRAQDWYKATFLGR